VIERPFRDLPLGPIGPAVAVRSTTVVFLEPLLVLAAEIDFKHDALDLATAVPQVGFDFPIGTKKIGIVLQLAPARYAGVESLAVVTAAVSCLVIRLRPVGLEHAQAARTRTINIRIDEERRTLIDRAAEAAGKDRTQFVLDAATREATTVLLDQRYFQLDTEAFAKFNAALDASPAENPRLRELLSRKAPWER
jgi:uncharacterized protein (DUF1778 family)